MEGVDLTQGLYFNAAQSVAQQSAASSKKKEKIARSKKNSFASALERSQQEAGLRAEGLPLEIAGMTTEEAVIYLKDAADVAADKLKERMLPENFADYRQKVTQFMRYIVKYNFEMTDHSRSIRARNGRKLEPHKQISIINKKLDEMAQWLLSSQRDTLLMLERVDEIRGLLVDLLAV